MIYNRKSHKSNKSHPTNPWDGIYSNGRDLPNFDTGCPTAYETTAIHSIPTSPTTHFEQLTNLKRGWSCPQLIPAVAVAAAAAVTTTTAAALVAGVGLPALCRLHLAADGGDLLVHLVLDVWVLQRRIFKKSDIWTTPFPLYTEETVIYWRYLVTLVYSHFLPPISRSDFIWTDQWAH